MQAALVLEDGRVFPGEGFGARGVSTGEIVFNTSMTGYQEILTDPSYHRQVITMTAPHIGNTGVNLEDPESGRVWAAGFVVRSLSPIVSNWRNRGDLASYLEQHNIIGVSGVATRALVRHIRERGVMRAAIAHGPAADDAESLIRTARDAIDMSGANLVDEVSVAQAYDWHEASDSRWYGDPLAAAEGPLVVAYDFGVKRNILRMLTDRGLRVRVVPAWTCRRRCRGHESGRRFPKQRPGRSRRRDLCHRQRQRPAGSNACLWHLPRASDSGAGAWRRHRENALRASWR